MKTKNLLALLVLIALNFSFFKSYAQDTVTVQTLTFSDISKRRGTYLFPDKSEKYSKILMYYTLKCDAATPFDSYNCGEWDYLTYTMVYDKNGVMDSTYKSNYNFTVAGATPNTLSYTTNPIYDYHQNYLYSLNNTATTSYSSGQVGNGSTALAHPFVAQAGESRSQYIFTAAELTTAGVVTGDISGLQLYFNNAVQANNFKIKLKHITAADFTVEQFENGLNEVYHYNVNVAAAGWKSFQFTNNFTWNGTDNILVEMSLDNGANIGSITLAGNTAAANSGLTTSGKDYFLSFSQSGDFVDLGSALQINGTAQRTLEAWGYAKSFNDAGLFQAGRTGTTGEDFSFRTMTTDNVWRFQMWGTPDFDVTAANSKNSWHHFAVTFNGTTAKVYYDGVQVGIKNVTINTGENNMWLGRWAGSYFNGYIDEFRVWNTALPQSSIQAFMRKDVDNSHPEFANLVGNYTMDEGTGINVADASGQQTWGALAGSTWWQKRDGDELIKNATITSERPNVIFEQGVYTSTLDSILVLDSVLRSPLRIVIYNNPAPGIQVPDNATNHPSIATDTIMGWAGNVYSYTYNQAGNKVDSTLVAATNTLTKTLREWYSPSVTYEIGRFITPYGIGLTLGNNGFTWVYDVTDYEPLLHDSVDLSAANTQELIDLKFVFIKGEPAADVVRIDQVWNKGYASYSYANLDNDVNASATEIATDPNASEFKVKMRLTGHGHNSNTGNFPHCCEWKDNTHYLFANNQLVGDWHIFQYHECAENPVYPQGGTWPGAREGWCPGDLVKEKEFNVTSYVQNNAITLDYDITPVPSNNQGMGGGNYIFAGHLIEYGAPKHALDAEVYEVLRPSTKDYQRRSNPICNGAKVIIRNNGTTTLNKVKIAYSVSGGTEYTYEWVGTLTFLEKAEVTLPLYDDHFWMGDGTDKFNCSIVSLNNGLTDENSANNTYSSNFVLPDLYSEALVIQFKTNNRASENTYTVKDFYGNVVFSRTGLSNNTVYLDTVDAAWGCFTLEISDAGDDGLSYWADAAAGSGYIRIKKLSGQIVKNFEPEFGRFINYSFAIGSIQSIKESGIIDLLQVFPNPSEGIFTVEGIGMDGVFTVDVVSIDGRVVKQTQVNFTQNTQHQLDLTSLPKGVYILNVKGKNKQTTERIVIQ